MKHNSNTGGHAFTVSNTEATLKARTVTGEIITLALKEGKTTATCQGQELKIPIRLSEIGTLAELIEFLKPQVLTIVDSCLECIPAIHAKALVAASMAARPAYARVADTCAAHSAPCTGFGCAGDLCAAHAAPCAGDVCAGKVCAAYVGPCAGDVCGGDLCAAHAAPCAGDVCAAKGCTAYAAPCAGDICPGKLCAADAAPCAGAVCPGNVCAANAIPCAGDVHVGPCAVHIPYCPAIF